MKKSKLLICMPIIIAALFISGLSLFAAPAESELQVSPAYTIDRQFIPSAFSPQLDTLSTVTGAAAAALPLFPISLPFLDNFPYLTPNSIEDLLWYAATGGAVYAVSEIIKRGVSRTRPFPDSVNDPDKSFPSRHTALSFASAAFLSAYLWTSSDNPLEIGSDGKLETIYLTAAVWGLAVGTGFLRTASGAHFMTDVLAGAAVGILLGAAGGLSAALLD
ncbi:MAG: phosphatase PAP2 family protein [Spirochaetia bacterium]|nr:phosphatase PAP2 family protein [Spirochaetia bacterium]